MMADAAQVKASDFRVVEEAGRAAVELVLAVGEHVSPVGYFQAVRMLCSMMTMAMPMDRMSRSLSRLAAP